MSIGPICGNLNQLQFRITKRAQFTPIGAAGIQIERSVDPAELRYHIVAVDNIGNRLSIARMVGVIITIRRYLPASRPVSPQRPSRGGIALHFTIETVEGRLAIPDSDHMIADAAMSHHQSTGIQDKITRRFFE
jgi:hypothetical protein